MVALSQRGARLLLGVGLVLGYYLRRRSIWRFFRVVLEALTGRRLTNGTNTYSYRPGTESADLSGYYSPTFRDTYGSSQQHRNDAANTSMGRLHAWLGRTFTASVKNAQMAISRRDYHEHTDLTTVQACLLSTEHLDIGRIEKRTLFVRRLEELFPNDWIRERITRAAHELATEEECVLLTKLSSSDKWHVLNSCTNYLSELFASNHICFNEARRADSYYRSAWYVFTMTCTRTSGSGRFFITPSKPVVGIADVGQLCIRIVLVAEPELRRIASGELEAPAKGFFNERHAGRWRVLSRISSLFVRQLENVTGQAYSKTQDWGSNLCGSIGASALERRNQRIKQFGKNSTGYDFLPPEAAVKAATVTGGGKSSSPNNNNIKSPRNNSNNNSSNNYQQQHEQQLMMNLSSPSKGQESLLPNRMDSHSNLDGHGEGYDPYLPEDNCFLRIHIPFPGGTMVPAGQTWRKCTDVVLFS